VIAHLESENWSLHFNLPQISHLPPQFSNGQTIITAQTAFHHCPF